MPSVSSGNVGMRPCPMRATTRTPASPLCGARGRGTDEPAAPQSGAGSVPTRSVGTMVLYTNDGGTRWHRASVRELPGLRQIKFLNRRTGLLIGEASDQYPTGLFTTEDGSITWKLIPGPRVPGWTAADAIDGQNALLG